MKRRKKPPTAAGFTLVELLVVIGIITLLATMAMPSFIAIQDIARAAEASTRVKALTQGAEQYKGDHDLYPGQHHPEKLAGSGGGFTGSQVLAACLFGYDYDDIGDNSPPARSLYAEYRPGDLFTYKGEKNTVSDRYGSEGDDMAVLYYPSRMDTFNVQQYKEGDNSDYLDGGADYEFEEIHQYTGNKPHMNDSFAKFIRESRFRSDDDHPVNPNAFLMLGSGPNRRYGDDDDWKNW